jgi:hypothetical protein
MNTWLHRIKHWYEVSNNLLVIGYLSIGFSDLLYNKDIFKFMVSSDYQGDKLSFLKKESIKCWGPGNHRTIYSLKRFLCEFIVGDRILVPLDGSLSLYTIIGPAMTVSDLPTELLKELVPTGGIEPCYLDENGLLRNSIYGDEAIDLGYLWPVSPMGEDLKLLHISRTLADAALTARMKMRQTNGNISDISKSVDDVINNFLNNAPLSLYAKIMPEIAKTLCDTIRTKLNPDKFEKLVKWYFCHIGANHVEILSKFQDKKNLDADCDVEAIFDVIKVKIHVQVKFHEGETDEWAIRQIHAFEEDMLQSKNDETADDYANLFWVISNCSSFSSKAKDTADDASVRLIDGTSFSQMLLDAGIENLDRAFLG